MKFCLYVRKNLWKFLLSAVLLWTVQYLVFLTLLGEETASAISLPTVLYIIGYILVCLTKWFFTLVGAFGIIDRIILKTKGKH